MDLSKKMNDEKIIDLLKKEPISPEFFFFLKEKKILLLNQLDIKIKMT